MIPIRDDAPRLSTPYVNYFLVALNVVVFLYEVLAFDPGGLNQFMYQFGFAPAHLTSWIGGGHTTATAAVVPIFTSMFLHASWLHLIFNMWALWIFGDNVEDHLGSALYLVMYLLAGIAGSLVHTGFNPHLTVPSVGASGAIAGVMGAYFVLYPRARVLTILPVFFWFFAWLPAWVFLGIWFVGQVLSGAATSIAYTSSTAAGGGIAFWAHVGGFLSGVALIKVFPSRPHRYRYYS